MAQIEDPLLHLGRYATVDAMVPCAAARFGNKPAMTMTDTDASISFREIDLKVRHFAAGLSAHGLRRGSRVLLYLPNGIEWVIAYHSLAKIGAVVIPSNILLTPQEVSWMAKDAEADGLVLPGDRLDAFVACGSDIALIVTLGTQGTGRDIAFRDVYNSGEPPMVDIKPDDLWTIAYTSGTTGRPKGAMLTHGALFDSAAGTATIHVRQRGDRVLSALPFAHVYGNIVMNAAFLTGTEILLMPRFDAMEALRLIAARQVTLFEGVPTMYYQMLAHPTFIQTDFSSLDRCTVGGQTMPLAMIEAVEAAMGCPLLELWGMSEVAGPAASSSPYWRSRPGSVGLAFPGQEVRIADLADRDLVVSDETAGELCIRGTQVMTGYWKNPVSTAEAIDQDGWLHTGDVAIQHRDGSLRIVDRLKDVIITGGYNVYPAEIEAVIAKHPAVAMVAVAALPDAEKGEIAKAFIVLKPDHELSEEDLSKHCRGYLAAYKCPRAFAVVDDIPKTSTGKIMRRALVEY